MADSGWGSIGSQLRATFDRGGGGGGGGGGLGGVFEMEEEDGGLLYGMRPPSRLPLVGGIVDRLPLSVPTGTCMWLVMAVALVCIAAASSAGYHRGYYAGARWEGGLPSPPPAPLPPPAPPAPPPAYSPAHEAVLQAVEGFRKAMIQRDAGKVASTLALHAMVVTGNETITWRSAGESQAWWQGLIGKLDSMSWGHDELEAVREVELWEGTGMPMASVHGEWVRLTRMGPELERLDSRFVLQQEGRGPWKISFILNP